MKLSTISLGLINSGKGLSPFESFSKRVSDEGGEDFYQKPCPELQKVAVLACFGDLKALLVPALSAPRPSELGSASPEGPARRFP